MLRSEITELENLVGAILQQERADLIKSTPAALAENVAAVRDHCVLLKKRWTRELFSNAKDPVIKRYVEYHQAGIVRLSDQLFNHFPLQLTDASNQLQEELEMVLTFLHHQAYRFFDIDHQITAYFASQLLAQFEPKLTLFQHYEGLVNRELIHIFQTSVRETLADGLHASISFRQAEQVQNLMRMADHLLKLESTSTDSFALALYRQNLNTLHFHQWYCDHLLNQLRQFGNESERLQALVTLSATLQATFVNPDKALQPELPSIAVAVGDWLREQANSATGRTEGSKISEQFPLTLSVPQFALFIRVFYKTGCFPVENVAWITRFFCEHFTTKKQAHISPKSFGRAFYNLDQSAAAVVRDLLQKMLNYLNKTYFP